MNFKALLLVSFSLALSACSGMSKEDWGDYVRTAIEMDKGYVPPRASAQPQLLNSGFKPNAFGPGVHMNQYGQAVTLQAPGGAQGEMLQIKPNAYGPGVHMDQYGRPVRERPYP
ncbi:hypothetical protein [Pantoea sp. 18069]|uniref:hypothetical protein n=1 Tax=Pantoea sp. 18069 TaxID=2681415 RepID=UPI0013586488|nr:hypothetical protein [Pantoea sp. 18069]